MLLLLQAILILSEGEREANVLMDYDSRFFLQVRFSISGEGSRSTILVCSNPFRSDRMLGRGILGHLKAQLEDRVKPGEFASDKSHESMDEPRLTGRCENVASG